MSSRVIVALILGYSVGQLPDSSLPWATIKLAFCIAVIVLIFKLEKRDRGLS